MVVVVLTLPQEMNANDGRRPFATSRRLEGTKSYAIETRTIGPRLNRAPSQRSLSHAGRALAYGPFKFIGYTSCLLLSSRRGTTAVHSRPENAIRPSEGGGWRILYRLSATYENRVLTEDLMLEIRCRLVPKCYYWWWALHVDSSSQGIMKLYTANAQRSTAPEAGRLMT